MRGATGRCGRPDGSANTCLRHASLQSSCIIPGNREWGDIGEWLRGRTKSHGYSTGPAYDEALGIMLQSGPPTPLASDRTVGV